MIFAVGIIVGLGFFLNLNFLVFINGTDNIFLLLMTLTLDLYILCALWNVVQENMEVEGASIYDAPKEIGVLKRISEVARDIVENSPFWIFLSGWFILAGRTAWGLLEWIRFGVWNSYTSCEVLQILCTSNTNLIGLDRVFLWFGANDFALSFVLPLCMFLSYLTGKHPKSR